MTPRRPRPRAKGLAAAEARKASGLAEADAIRARAEALADNQDAAIGQQLAEKWPEIVEAAARPFGNVDQMILLNGAQGMSEVLAQALSAGKAGLQLARNLLSGGNGAGGTDAEPGDRGALQPPDAAPTESQALAGNRRPAACEGLFVGLFGRRERNRCWWR